MKNKEQIQIKTILFDLGNVLIVDTAEVFEKAAGYSKLSAKDKREYIAAWEPSETGKKPASILLRQMKKTFKLPYSTATLKKLLTHAVLIEPMWQVFEAVKLQKKYKVAILTNNERGWPEEQLKSVNKKPEVRIFNSAKIGHRKPDSRIYKYTLAALHTKPEETIFIDDKIKNIEGAQKVGINTIHFTGNMPAVVNALKKYGIEVKISKRK